MPRDKNIRTVIAPIIEELCQIYEDTSPALGTDSEWGKMQDAQYAFDLYWQLYGELMIWAQNHIIGYEHVRGDVQVAEIVTQASSLDQLHENAHDLELLGAFMTARVPYEDEKLEEKYNSIASRLEDDLSDSALRQAFIKMTLSRDSASSPIRSRLHQAFEEVEHGSAG